MFIYRYHTEIEIAAKVEQVWDVLNDNENYHEWNTFTPKVETNWQIGHPVLLTVKMRELGKAILQKEFIRRYNPPYEITWGRRWSVFLKAERIQTLTSKGQNVTEYFTEDIIQGPVSPLVHLLYGRSIQAGFERVAKGLKTYVEK